MRILVLLVFLLIRASTESLADLLDEVLGTAILPPNSQLCQGGGTSTTFSSTFASTSNVSHWDVTNAQYEKDVFEIDMTHSDVDPVRSWTIRLGKGGQISSFQVSAGEAIANQAVAKAIWNDLVQQMVAVNNALNTPTYPNFIHQAGPYAKDLGMPPPFYSPNVALHCDGNECVTINWGQQAHLPTYHDSPLLYYTRYRDCGDGIIQYDMAMHHFGQVASDVYNYFNTPWTGVRTSTFRDMMVANPAGKLEHAFPMGGFGPTIRNLDTTGGFTTFAEDLELDSDKFTFPFCVDTTKVLPQSADVPCDANNPAIIPFKFVVQENGTAKVNSLSDPYGLNYTVSMKIFNYTGAPIRIGMNGWGNPYDGVVLTNERTGFTFQSSYMIHFCWEDGNTYFATNVTSTVLNQELIQGDSLSVKYLTSGLPWESQRAFTFVHGTNPEFPQSWYRARSRIRYGTTTNRRDGTVWTTNFMGRLKPTQTYFARKFIITDRLATSEATAISLRDEAYEDVSLVNELEEGTVIQLWMNENSFGASIGPDSCGYSDPELACAGSSTPEAGYRPWFYVTCGSNTMTTTDPYYFAVYEETGGYILRKPYLCVNETETTRADWKLLGFFPDCSGIKNKVYSSDFCLESAPPSSTPNTTPDITLSEFCHPVQHDQCTLCEPFRSPDYCDPSESFPTLIQRRTSVFRDTPLTLTESGYWFHFLEDKIAAFLLSVDQQVPAPQIYCCVTNITDLSSCLESAGYKEKDGGFTIDSSSDGLVVKATNFHSNQGVFILVNETSYGPGLALDLIENNAFSFDDMVVALSSIQAEKIIVEQFIGSMLPVEYKLHVINGVVQAIDIVQDRAGNCRCYGVVDKAWDRLDQFGCFEPGGISQQNQHNPECTAIDFDTGMKKAGPVKKDMGLCETLIKPEQCVIDDMISIAESLGNRIGVAIRIDMFVVGNNVYVQEYSANPMNGLRHCAAKLDSNGCIDSCFLGREYKAAGLHGGTSTTAIPNSLVSFSEKTPQEQCDLIKNVAVGSTFVSSCIAPP